MYGYLERVRTGTENGTTARALLGESEDSYKGREVSGTAV